MSTRLLLMHLLLAGLWVGCVATEVVFERLLIQDTPHHALLARLHRRVDLWVELPAFVLTALTGGVLWWKHVPVGFDPWLMSKVACGAVAVLANLACVRVVVLRDRAITADDRPRFSRLDQMQHQLGALVLMGMVGAVGLGLWRGT